MRKVFAADDYSAIAIAGAAGQAVELVKLFQLELEHYEKITATGSRWRARPTAWRR
jgi:proteasome beta subunit